MVFSWFQLSLGSFHRRHLEAFARLVGARTSVLHTAWAAPKGSPSARLAALAPAAPVVLPPSACEDLPHPGLGDPGQAAPWGPAQAGVQG
eukprot:CAMPEP_0204490850 /NCGR_PEP_ID=MMETSP0471-20130131/75830_1 /ASSEMBLY_ACC=CAM_ASM_000602 /TAXON_ID=2969 /ORGANISM="Oxyrrhis marina" /LENGTH=89 /DNA_ID=CAMNT_0051494809 /DNA_START=96 /DNA_END=362 /DNA_ORIENTATION=-